MFLQGSKQNNARMAAIIMALLTVSFIESWPLGFAKYLAIVLSIFMIHKNAGWEYEKSLCLPFVFCFVLFTSTCLMQNTTFPQKMISVIIYFVLLSWVFFGGKLISTPLVLYKMAEGIFWPTVLGMILTRNQSLAQLENVNNFRKRIWGGFSHANTLGSICVSGIILILCYLILSKRENAKKIYKMKSTIMVIVFSAFLYLSDSRTSVMMLFTFCGSWLTICCLRKFEKKTRVLILLIIVSGLLGIGYWFIYTYAIGDTTFLMRYQTIEKTNISGLLLWVGSGMIGASSSVETSDFSQDINLEIAWIMILYKNGVIGVILYIFIFLYTVVYELLNPYKDFYYKGLFWAVFLFVIVGSMGEAFIAAISHVIAMVGFVLLSFFSNPPKNPLAVEKTERV